MKKKALILFPTIQEAEPIRQIYAPETTKLKLEDSFTFSNDDIDFTAFILGYGAKITESRIKKAIEKFNPEIIFLIGCAGACKKGIELGEMFYAGNDETLANYALSFGAKEANIYTNLKFADDTQKAELAAQGYDIVEMEYSYLKNVCKDNGIKYICIRFISDVATSTSPIEFFNALMCEKTGKNKTLRALSTFIWKPSNMKKLKEFLKDIASVMPEYDKKIKTFIGDLKL
ncbi:MAG: hypothetical protein R3Y46_06620 [Opitutales bacterium]